MTMTKSVAHLRIARQLADAEASLNDALIKQSQLFATMVAARKETGVATTLGHDVLLRMNKSQMTMLSAGGDLARVHGRLLEIGRDLDVVRMDDECPSVPSPGGHLSEDLDRAA
jgi:hypothetical protein